MKSIILKKNNSFTSGTISIPYSKSLSNRAIIIRALSGEAFNILHLSKAEDTQNLLKNINNTSDKMDVGPAGTNMRFLTSYYAIQKKRKIQIGGTDRLNQRPIRDLVDSLNQMGANISYIDHHHFPPLLIEGKELKGGHMVINGSKSSQFISSILMIAPYITGGIKLEIQGKIVSEPYIHMTLELMKYFGVKYLREKNIIHIHQQNYIPKDYSVEGDWSSAAMLYSYISGAQKNTSINIKNVALNSLQGDKKCADYFSLLGVKTEVKDQGICISKTEQAHPNLSFDLNNEPDLFPPLVVGCILNRVIASFTGLDTLPQKESDRIIAMATELSKLNIEVEHTPSSFSIKSYLNEPSQITFDTYHDHRIAMSLSAIIQLGIEVTIQDPEVVSKSYPSFWEDLKIIEIANIY